MHLHLDALARDRVAELAQEPRHHRSPLHARGRAGSGRRALARALAAISLACAAAVRRLDASLDDGAQAMPCPDGS